MRRDRRRGRQFAGQAAIYLSQIGSRVSVVVRRADLSSSMSRYLIDRIVADPKSRYRPKARYADSKETAISRELFLRTAQARAGDSSLRCPLLLYRGRSGYGMVQVSGGAGRRWFRPHRRSLSAEVLTDPSFMERDPLPYETSAAGGPRVGDVRSGSMNGWHRQ